MKIEKLAVYGFGKHENLIINLNEELAIFYGNNEAGKTTIQQFIIQILFGFPPRNQAGNRYEPKAGGRYGGQLYLTDEYFGKVIIERIKGKSAGDVTVYFEDGSRGAETELKKILRDYDRVSFESIFSFSIHELQGLDKMTEDQLSRTLLASGTTGVDAITQMETELEKDMGTLFKKGGRNPQLNLLIEKLRDDENDLKQHREQADLYGPYLKQTDELNVQLEELSKQEDSISRSLAELAKQQQAAPLMQQSRSLNVQLSSIANFTFPADGSRRMDLLSERLSEVLAKKAYIEKELTMLPDPLNSEKSVEEFEKLLQKESEWLRFLSNQKDLKEDFEKLQEELDRHLGLIGMRKEEAFQFDVSLVNEEKLLILAERADKEKENSRYRNRELQDEKKKLIDAEKEMSYLETTAPTEEQQDAAAKWPENAIKLAEAKALKAVSNESGNRFLSYLFIVFGASGVLTGLVSKDALIVVLAFGVALGGIWLLWKARQKTGRFEDINGVIQRFGGKEVEMEMLQHKIVEHNRKVEETLRIISRTDKKIEDLTNEMGYIPVTKEFEEFLQSLGIVSTASQSTVIELFKSIRKVQEIQAKLNRTQISLKRAEKEEQNWIQKVATATGCRVETQDLFTVLRLEAKKRHELNEKNNKIGEKRKALLEKLQQRSSYLQRLESEKQILLEESGAKDIDEFHHYHLEWMRKSKLQQELELIRSQLEAINLTALKQVETDYSVEMRINDLKNELSQVKTKRNQLVTERAELQQKVNHLLTDDAYEIKLQNFEEKKAQFKELAHQWSVDKGILESIRSTMTELKEKSLPAVLIGACEYFQRLTRGSYTGMEIHPDGHFEAIRTDNTRFRIAELSQATKEQAYLALRFSLAASMHKSYPFPIIMDDPFVHFDRLRLQQVINLIKELQTNHQFIYFTCHDEMRKAWPEAQEIDMANTGRSVYL